MNFHFYGNYIRIRTHIHTYTHRKREREHARENCLYINTTISYKSLSNVLTPKTLFSH